MLYVKGNEVRLTRGDTAYLNVVISRSSDPREYTMNPKDILTLTVKKKVTDTEILFQKVVEGTTEIHILPEDTSGLEYGAYKYDVQLNTVDGDVYTVIEPSSFTVMPEVTF